MHKTKKIRKEFSSVTSPLWSQNLNLLSEHIGTVPENTPIGQYSSSSSQWKLFPCMIQDMKIEPDSLRCILGCFQKIAFSLALDCYRTELMGFQPLWGNLPIVENPQTEGYTAQCACFALYPRRVSLCGKELPKSSVLRAKVLF